MDLKAVNHLLQALLADLGRLVAEDRRRGDARWSAQAEYWYGRAFGLETAADDLKGVKDVDSLNPEVLERLAMRWDAMALEAGDRADRQNQEEMPNLYAYYVGVADGLEYAAKRQKEMIGQVRKWWLGGVAIYVN